MRWPPPSAFFSCLSCLSWTSPNRRLPNKLPPPVARPATLPPLQKPRMPTSYRCELLLFLATFFAFAYFNQGGGWNQNARFAEVRAMVEEGRFAIDNFLVYQLDDSGQDVVRLPLTKGEYEWEGKRNRLCWVDMTWSKFVPLGSHPLGDAAKVTIVEKCASGDIGYV